MSTTTVKAIWLDKVEDLEEYQNAHGSAPVIWDEIAQKYLHLKPFEYNFHTEKLWPLWKNQSIPKHHRAVLAMTYDRAVIEKEYFKRAAEDIKQYLIDFPPHPDYANHWTDIASLFESDPDCEAIGFHWTSVSEDLFEGNWNEEKDDYDFVDLTQFWSMYRQLDKQTE